jgi:hypothetical protein
MMAAYIPTIAQYSEQIFEVHIYRSGHNTSSVSTQVALLTCLVNT